ncbi:hypothetical protein FQZ97_1035380 [compost metagenome]
MFALAAWLAFLVRNDPDGQPLPLNDPRATELQPALKDAATPSDIIHAVALVCPDVLPAALTNGVFGFELNDMLTAMLSKGMGAVIEQEAMGHY